MSEIRAEVTLPDKLSELITLALGDLEQVEALPERFQVDMGRWHTAKRNSVWFEQPNDQCSVCFAGAVMAMTLELSDMADAGPGSFDPATERKLRALNDVRSGFVYAALDKLDQPTGDYRDYCEPLKITPYSVDPVEFKQQLRELSKQLEERGL